ncbi:MAG: DUF488 domain-containing protein [Chloroflexi bacterium]|nr:DUF488 domain-containing protein [Chloroflexota bacterium]
MSGTPPIYTLGFAGKSAEEFFGLLRRSGIKRVIDVRLNNVSQLAGFTKRQDIAFFLKELCGAEYVHEPMLAPTKEILDDYRKDRSWARYTERYLALMAGREVESHVSRALFEGQTALLCSEPTPDRCHRRLALEYLQSKWGGMEIVHL